jgi:hypothetical protein
VRSQPGVIVSLTSGHLDISRCTVEAIHTRSNVNLYVAQVGFPIHDC